MNHHNRIKKLEDNLLISEKYYVPLTYGYTAVPARMFISRTVKLLVLFVQYTFI